MRAARRRFALALLAAALAGCVSASEPVVQRAAEGPTADDLYRAGFLRGYGRPPSTDEYLRWRAEVDGRVVDYLARHPALLVSPRVTRLRALRQVGLGMSKEEVTLLAGAPDATTTDRAEMQAAARQFWPEVGRRAAEMWRYPGGWHFYFEGDRLVDLTVVGAAPIE